MSGLSETAAVFRLNDKQDMIQTENGMLFAPYCHDCGVDLVRMAPYANYCNKCRFIYCVACWTIKHAAHCGIGWGDAVK